MLKRVHSVPIVPVCRASLDRTVGRAYRAPLAASSQATDQMPVQTVLALSPAPPALRASTLLAVPNAKTVRATIVLQGSFLSLGSRYAPLAMLASTPSMITSSIQKECICTLVSLRVPAVRLGRLLWQDRVSAHTTHMSGARILSRICFLSRLMAKRAHTCLSAGVASMARRVVLI